jgi:ribosome maturation factor RimP
VGERVKIKTRPSIEPRRTEGVVVEAAADGVAIDTGAERVHLSYDEIERARTVFEWGAAPKPVSPSKKGPSS